MAAKKKKKVNKAKTVRKASSVNPLNEEYKDFIDDKENIKNAYDIGFYKLLLTDYRIILKKNVSHSLQSFKYKDIELVEYITDVRWIFAFISIVLFVTSYLFLVSIPEAGSFTMINFQVKHGVITSTQSSEVFNSYLLNLGGFIAFVFAIYYFFKFAYTLFGKLRIYLQNSKLPVDVICKFNKDIPGIINHVERKT